ncbi:MAG: alpha-galactosidase [Acidobacteria bacterium]|nr:alpha-galactosidase [Acidobacteriota bacterium]
MAQTCGFFLLGILLLTSCQKAPKPTVAPVPRSSIQVTVQADGVSVVSSAAEFVLSSSGYLSAKLRKNGAYLTLDDAQAGGGQKIVVGGKAISDFVLDLSHAQVREATGKLGKTGKEVMVEAHSASTGLDETLRLELYDDLPSLAILSATLHNSSNAAVPLDEFTLQEHHLNASIADAKAQPHALWAFFGSSLKWGKDEILPLPAKFSQENPFSLPVDVDGDAGGAGGGIPVVAFWTRQVGEAIGHIETLPLVLSIPVQTESDGRVTAAVRLPAQTTLQPGETYSTPRTFVAVYAGDYYQPLSLWAQALDREGLARPSSNPEDYAVSWCGWGYKADVTPKQMTGTIPKLKELGIHWATLDDRWFNNYGDWKARADTFPGDSMQKLVKDFHAQGIKIQIWWLPLGVEIGQNSSGDHKYMMSDVAKEHPDWLILDKSGKPALMARNLATLCPALPEVQAYHKQLTERFIRDWDFDGHKLDNIFATPRCYNPKHHHKSPDDSVHAMGEVYKVIFEATRALKPDSVTQSCACGTPPSLAWFRYMDQAVTGDPVGAAQVRRRIKMYKAILGPKFAVYGDHVELTRILDPNTPKVRQLGEDFASTMGTGGVPGTKFTWPDYGAKFSPIYLTPEKEAHWKKWIGLYNEKMLSQGAFEDLYTLGYDDPEGYAIAKDGKIYYAFFEPEPSPATTAVSPWEGAVELRGLQAQAYKVVDYVHEKDYGTVQGPVAKLKVHFQDNLLLEATPVAGPAR